MLLYTAIYLLLYTYLILEKGNFEIFFFLLFFFAFARSKIQEACVLILQYFSNLFKASSHKGFSHQQGTNATWSGNFQSDALALSRKGNSRINLIVEPFQDMFYNFSDDSEC